MEKKISLGELENLIRKNITAKGLMGEISEEKIQEIKHKLKQRLSLPSAMFGHIGIAGVSNPYIAPPAQLSGDYDVDGGSDGDGGGGGVGESLTMPPELDDLNVSHEIQNMIPEKDLVPNYIVHPETLDPQSDEPQTTEDNSYQPKLPESIEKASPEKIFIFNDNELSVGAETLRTLPFHMVDNPDEKMSMEDMWLEKAKIRAEVYKVEFKKIGELVFRPNDGICKFEQSSEAIPAEVPCEDQDSVQQAIQSQEPIEPMADAVEPVMDVTLPLTGDMGLESPDVQKATLDVIEKALRHYLMSKENGQL